MGSWPERHIEQGERRTDTLLVFSLFMGLAESHSDIVSFQTSSNWENTYLLSGFLKQCETFIEVFFFFTLYVYLFIYSMPCCIPDDLASPTHSLVFLFSHSSLLRPPKNATYL